MMPASGMSRAAGKHLLTVATEPPTGTRRDVRAPYPMTSPGTLCFSSYNAQAWPGSHNRFFRAEDLLIKPVRHPEAACIKM